MSLSDACDAAGDAATPDETRVATDRMETGGGTGRVLDFDLDLSPGHVMPKDAFPIPADSCGDEKLPLLADHDGSYRARACPAHARRFTISFFLMAACFSVNHGTVTGCDQLPSSTTSLPPSFLNPTPPLTAFNCPLSSPLIHKNRNVKPVSNTALSQHFYPSPLSTSVLISAATPQAPCTLPTLCPQPPSPLQVTSVCCPPPSEWHSFKCAGPSITRHAWITRC